MPNIGQPYDGTINNLKINLEIFLSRPWEFGLILIIVFREGGRWGGFAQTCGKSIEGQVWEWGSVFDRSIDLPQIGYFAAAVTLENLLEFTAAAVIASCERALHLRRLR